MAVLRVLTRLAYAYNASASGALAGRDFLIELESDSSTSDLSTSGASSSGSYLLSTGATETDSQNATLFTDRGGRLYAGQKHYSAPPDVSFILFEASYLNQAIDTIFGISSDYLYWDNAAFDGGAARFCLDSADRLEAIFKGPLPAGCAPIRLRVASGRSIHFPFQRRFQMHAHTVVSSASKFRRRSRTFIVI